MRNTHFRWYYECECGFKIGHTVAQVPIPEELMQELLTTGKTREKITGFVSKAGNSFDAHLKYADEKIQFDFNSQGDHGSQSKIAAESAPPAPQPWLDPEPASDEYWASLMAGAAEEPVDVTY